MAKHAFFFLPFSSSLSPCCETCSLPPGQEDLAGTLEMPCTPATRLSSQPKHSPDLPLNAFLSQLYLAKQPRASNLICFLVSVTQVMQAFH